MNTIVTFFRNKLARIRYKLTPSLLLLKRDGGLPSKDSYIYKTITATGTRLTYWQDIVGGTILWIALGCIISAFASIPWMRSVGFSETMVLVGFFLFFVGMIFISNMEDPVEIIRSLASRLDMSIADLCRYPEEGLKLQAYKVLCYRAELHSDRQRHWLPNEPAFQETYRAYSETHALFQKYGLIPKDIGWKPYFERTATLTF